MKNPDFLKKLLFGLIVIGIPLTLLSAAIRWYNDAGIPQKTVLDGAEIFSIQQTGPNAYRWALASDVRSYMAGNPGAPVNNIYVTVVNAVTNYVTYQYVTNSYVNLQYVTNQYVTTNYNTYQYVTNQYVNLSYVTNQYITTNIVNNEWVTNQYVTYSFTTNLSVTYLSNLYSYISNAYITNLYVSNAYITNLTVDYTTNNYISVKTLTVQSNIFYLSANPEDRAWSGPTNQVDFNAGQLQYYTTLVPVSVTNVINPTNGYGSTVLLCITNSSGSNVTITLPSGWHKGRSDPTSITNGGIGEIWFQEATGRKTIATKEFLP